MHEYVLKTAGNKLICLIKGHEEVTYFDTIHSALRGHSSKGELIVCKYCSRNIRLKQWSWTEPHEVRWVLVQGGK